MPTLFLIHGFVGSGKTTFSKKLSTEQNAVRFSPDEWMSHFYGQNPPADLFLEYDTLIKDMIWQQAEQFLLRGNNVILDYGFWGREGRDKYRYKAQELNIECILYAMNSDFETCKKRALKRTEELPKGELTIDENALNMFWKRFEPLADDEVAIKV